MAGFVLDSYDVLLYVFLVQTLRAEFHWSAATAGLVSSATLIASALGGIGAGFLADRIGAGLATLVGLGARLYAGRRQYGFHAAALRLARAFSDRPLSRAPHHPDPAQSEGAAFMEGKTGRKSLAGSLPSAARQTNISYHRVSQALWGVGLHDSRQSHELCRPPPNGRPH